MSWVGNSVSALEATMALASVQNVSRQTKRALFDAVDDPAKLFGGTVPFADRATMNKVLSFNGWEGIRAELARLDTMGVTPLSLSDREYPPLLRNIPDAPLLLFKRGSLGLSSETIAIVGSRKATFAGLNLAEKVAETLSSVGITVISGFARGIDTASHRGALRDRGKTAAVLGCGIDICYPPQNGRLFEQIGAEGAIFTEYRLGERPLGFHFPERNRIIAGLSKGILVVEAATRSGSLITARLGLEYGREVMSVPGSIFTEEHKGANLLIKEGARLIDTVEDIITHCFPGTAFRKSSAVDMNEEEDYIYSLVGTERTHIDEVVERSGLETKRVMALVTRLEMKDLIRGFPGGYYIKR